MYPSSVPPARRPGARRAALEAWLARADELLARPEDEGWEQEERSGAVA